MTQSSGTSLKPGRCFWNKRHCNTCQRIKSNFVVKTIFSWYYPHWEQTFANIPCLICRLAPGIICTLTPSCVCGLLPSVCSVEMCPMSVSAMNAAHQPCGVERCMGLMSQWCLYILPNLANVTYSEQTFPLSPTLSTSLHAIIILLKLANYCVIKTFPSRFKRVTCRPQTLVGEK